MIRDIGLTLERYGISDFLFYKTDETNINKAHCEILKKMYFPTILPIQVLNKSDANYLRYDLTTEHTLAAFLGGKNTKQKLIRLLDEINDTLKLLSNVNLEINNIVFNKDYIFINESTNKFQFVYLPINKVEAQSITLNEFLRDILFTIKYEDDDWGFFVNLFNKIVTEGINSLKDLGEIMSSIEGNYLEEISQKITIPKDKDIIEENNDKVNSLTKTEVDNNIDNKIIDIKEKVNSIKVRSINIISNPEINTSSMGDKANKNRTGLLSQDSLDFETTALANYEGLDSKAYVLTYNNSKKVIVDKEIFKIGRDSSIVDCVILNKAVGREHGEIVFKNGEYYFKDNNSTNGSYINGTKVSPMTKYKIKHKDIIKLANEEIIFKLY